VDLNVFDKPISNKNDVSKLPIKNERLKEILYDLVKNKKSMLKYERPLHIAVKNGEDELAKELTMYGASIHSINGAGHTPLDETYDYNRPAIRKYFESLNQEVPEHAKVMYQLKFLAVFFSTKGEVSWNNQFVKMEDGISFRTVEKFMAYIKNYTGPKGTKQIEIDAMRNIFDRLSCSSELLGKPNATDMAYMDIEKNKFTIVDSGSDSHATYGVFLNKPSTHPDKLFYANINRGAGSEYHLPQPGYHDRSDVSYILDISHLNKRELWSFIHDINSIGNMDYETSTKFLYGTLEKKYSVDRLIDPRLTVFQKNQTVGNCPASSLKGTMKFLFDLEFGKKRGDELFYHMTSIIKARAFVDTLIHIENLKGLDAEEKKKTVCDLIKLYIPKIRKRAIFKEDRIFLNELSNLEVSLRNTNENPKSKKILQNLVCKICL
jgi:hypothetical protein